MCTRSFRTSGTGRKRGLAGSAIRGPLHLGRKLLIGDKHMTTSNWQTSPRWRGITRPYTKHDVSRLRGSFQIEHTIARRPYLADSVPNLVRRPTRSTTPKATTTGQSIHQ
jgi:hypothetical protein